jgi:hypothetical protein
MSAPAMPGTDRDRALALGVMMCLQRERQWHFTLSMGQAWFWSTITLGIRPLHLLSRRFARYRRHERMTLEHFCDALQLHIGRADVERIRDALPSAESSTRGVCAVREHEAAMRRLVASVNAVLPLYDLPVIDAGLLEAEGESAPSLLAALFPPWNWWAMRCAHEVRRYVETRSLLVRTELAQRLAELRWTPIEADDDGVTRVR